MDGFGDVTTTEEEEEDLRSRMSKSNNDFFDGLNKIAWAPPPNSHQMHAGQLVTPEQLQM